MYMYIDFQNMKERRTTLLSHITVISAQDTKKQQE